MANDKLTQPARELLGKELAPAGRDWAFYNRLSTMVNPDPILRRVGKAQEVYAAIMADAHVMGDIRSIRGSLRSYRYRVVSGDEDNPRANDARDACALWLQSYKPNAVAQDWLEVMWQMESAIFTGFKVHELVWDLVDGRYVPTAVKDRANTRFRFDAQGQLLLMGTGAIEGVAVEPYRFVVSRHMPTCENPYGHALLSSCFWPWTFKTGGFKYFMQYCEKYAIPVPFGKYPQGATHKDIETLENALADFINGHYVVAVDGTSIDLLTPAGSGAALPQESLINLCNREMSKALTSQAMTAELQNTGARAASETAADRQEMVNNADRDIASGSMSEIFKWITLFNFGEGVPSPVLEFFAEKQAGKERAEVYQAAAAMGARPSRRALLEELNIPEAVDDADAIVGSPMPAQKVSPPAADFSEPTKVDGDDAEQAFERVAIDALDVQLADDVIEPFAQMLAEFEESGRSLAEFQEHLGEWLGGVAGEDLRVLVEQALTLSALNGAHQSIKDIKDPHA